MPLTQSIIVQVLKLAELDKIPKGFKLQNKTDSVLFDSAWITGVDYDPDECDDDDYPSSYKTSSDEDEDSEDNNNNFVDYSTSEEILDAPVMHHATANKAINEGNEDNPNNKTTNATSNDRDSTSPDIYVFQNEEEEIIFQTDLDARYAPSDSNDKAEQVTTSNDETGVPAIEDNPSLFWSSRTKDSKRQYAEYYSHLHTLRNTEEYTPCIANIVAMAMAHYSTIMIRMDESEST
eukprot:15332738-Ditylum_brightwellii.AAC.1